METTSKESLEVALENLAAINHSLYMLVNCYYEQPEALQDKEKAEGLMRALSSTSNNLSATLNLLSKSLELRGLEEEYSQAKQENRERLIAESASKPVNPSSPYQ